MPSRAAERRKQRYAEDPVFREKVLATNSAWADKNREKINARQRLKYNTDPEHRSRINAQSRRTGRSGCTGSRRKSTSGCWPGRAASAKSARRSIASGSASTTTMRTATSVVSFATTAMPGWVSTRTTHACCGRPRATWTRRTTFRRSASSTWHARSSAGQRRSRCGCCPAPGRSLGTGSPSQENGAPELQQVEASRWRAKRAASAATL